MLNAVLKTLALVSTIAVASAQSQYPNQSQPFNLVVQSTTNATLNGQKLGACHTGAGLESLCIYESDDAPFYTYYFNTSATTPSSGAELGQVTWNLQGSNFVTNEPLTFFYNPGSNLAFPILEFTSTQTFTFTDDGLLAVPVSTNDAVNPPTYETAYVSDRWAICVTYWAGYTYTALQWVLGDQPAQNPTCESVTIKRVFI